MALTTHFSILLLLLLLLLLLAAVTYNQVQPFQVNNYSNHNVDIEITGYRELYSINCKQQCLHVCIYIYIYIFMSVCVLLIYQEFLFNFSDLAIITAQTYHNQSHRRPMFNTFSRYVMCYTVNM